jgi:dihydrolipoyl dehydrogenase
VEKIKTKLAIVGAGPGGYVAAIRAGQLGLSPILIEKESVGGVCLNRGCIPSKAIIHAADLVSSLKSAGKIGIKVEGLTVDFPKVIAWKDRIVKKLTLGVGKLVEANGGRIVSGTAKFLDSSRLHVSGDEELEIEAEKILIATGSRSAQVPSLPFDGKTVISSREVLSLNSVPTSMLVVGGGVIGLELGQAFAKLGASVTIVEMLDSLLPGTESKLLEPLMKILKRLRVKVHLGARAEKVSTDTGIAQVTIKKSDGTLETIEVEKVLVTVGRTPNTSGLGLENTSVKLDGHGFIQVGPDRLTDDPNIYAIGDAAGGMLLAHKASSEGMVAAENIAGNSASFVERIVPAVVYTDPEIATAGLSLTAAAEKGINVISGEYSFAGHGRASTMDKPEGFVRLVANKDSEKILGAQIVGAGAGELIGEAVLAIEGGLTLHQFAEAIRPHPTMCEGLTEAAEDALGRAIHTLSRT